ncbi:MAG: hypothetical protein Q9170_003611 [Blastenia crenularia]
MQSQSSLGPTARFTCHACRENQWALLADQIGNDSLHAILHHHVPSTLLSSSNDSTSAWPKHSAERQDIIISLAMLAARTAAPSRVWDGQRIAHGRWAQPSPVGMWGLVPQPSFPAKSSLDEFPRKTVLGKPKAEVTFWDMSVGKAPPCVPTWRGHVETTKDALLIFEGCFQGTLAHCFRRPHDRERAQLIVSGNVFVYEEATSGIKRWTDGIPWSPSRILTNFLIYRQLNSPFPPGEKKRATKRSQRVNRPGEPYPTPAPSTTVKDEYPNSFSPESPGLKSDEGTDKDGDRGLVGSLVDSYEFKEKGLLKKTMTVTIKGVQHHLVSYYSLEDAKHSLRTPREDEHLKNLNLRPELLQQPKFKFQNLDDAGDGAFEHAEMSQQKFSYVPHNFDPSRPYMFANHGQVPFINPPSQCYYPNVQPYVTPEQSPNGVPYGTLATTPAGYAPTPTVSASVPGYGSNRTNFMSLPYSPQLPQSHANHHSHQQPRYQMQQQQHISSLPGQQMQSSRHQQYPTNTTLSRSNGNFDTGSVSHESNGVHQGAFDSYNSPTTPMNSTIMYPGMSHLPAGYINPTTSYAVRPDGTSQPYRAY